MLTIPPLAVLSITPAQNAQYGAPQQTGQQFSAGEILRATVLEARSDARFLLEVGGSRVLIQAETPLSVGQMLDVEVRGSNSRLELQILPTTSHQLFGQALANVAKNHDLTALFSVLQNIPADQLQNLTSTSRQTLESFALLLQETFPSQAGSQQVSAQEILNRFFDQAATPLNSLLTSGKQEAAVTGIKTVIQDIAQFFVSQSELKTTSVDGLIGKVSVTGQRILEAVFTLQNNAPGLASPDSGEQTSASRLLEGAANTLLESVGINPHNPFGQGKAEIPLGLLSKGLGELIFLLKSPESMNQLLTLSTLRSGFITDRQQGMAVQHNQSSPGLENSGQALKELVSQLGLNLEKLLASGNKEAAAQTVKLALHDLIQNSQDAKSVQENGQKVLKTLEFYQLAQLQINRSDISIIPLPCPFLQKGYLLVEDDSTRDSAKNGHKYTNRRFSLYLALKEIGNLKIDFHNDDLGLSIRFYCESEQVAEFIAEHQNDLKENISNVAIKEISFSEGGGDPLTELVKKCVPPGKSFFNLKA